MTNFVSFALGIGVGFVIGVWWLEREMRVHGK